MHVIKQFSYENFDEVQFHASSVLACFDHQPCVNVLYILFHI